MYSIEEFIHQLVHSMTKAEKKHFKMEATHHRGKKEYLKLFDAITKQDRHDQEALKQKLKMTDAKFRRTKHYLQEAIIEAQVTHRIKTIPENYIKITRNSLMMEVLLSKGLYDDMEALLDKTKSINDSSGRIEEQLILKRLESSRNPERMYNVEYLNSFFDEYQNLIDELQINVQMDKIRKQHAIQIIYGAYGDKPLEVDFNDRYFRNEINNKSIRTRDYYYRTAINHYYHLGKLDRALELAEEWCNMYSTVKSKNYQNQRHLLAISNAIDLNYTLGNIDRAIQYLEEYHEVKNQGGNKAYHTWYLIVEYSYRSLTLLKKGKAEDAKKYVYDLYEHLQDPKIAFATDAGLYAYNAMGLMLFLIGDYSRAIPYLNDVIKNSSNTSFPKIHLSAKILLAVTLFEKGDYNTTESFMRSIYRTVKKRKHPSSFDLLIAKLLRKLSTSSTKTYINILVETRKEFDIIKEDWHKDKFFLNFNLIDWLESKIQGVSIMEVMKEN